MKVEWSMGIDQNDLKTISEKVAPIAKKFGVKRVALFGSVARGDNIVQSSDSFITDSLTGILMNDYDEKSDSFISEKTHYLDK